MLLKLRIIIVFIVCSLFMSAQSVHTHNLNMESGLSSNYIRTLYKDSQGFIWIGTDTGLERYDGSSITSYTKRFKTPLKGAVQALVEMDKNLFIVATSWGAFRYDVSRNEITPIYFGFQVIDVRAAIKSRNGSVYFATDKGLFLIKKNESKARLFTYTQSTPLSFNSLQEDESGQIWAGGNEGLFCILSTNRVVKQEGLYPYGQNIKTMLLIDNNLYLGTMQGLFSYNLQRRELQPVGGLENTTILSLTADAAQHLYAGTDNEGIFVINTVDLQAKVTERYHTSARNISSNNIFALLYDDAQILWIGSLESGVDYLYLQNSPKFRTFEFPANIRSMFFSAEGSKYLGTRNGIVYQTDINNNITRTTTGHFNAKVLTTIFPHPLQADLLIIGSFAGGISLYNKTTGHVQPFSNHKVFNNATVYKFCTDKNQNLWIATLDGVYRYNLRNRTYVKLNTAEVTGSNEVFSMFYDRDDKLWFGTKNGSCYYSLSQNKLVMPRACQPYRYQCTSIFVDSRKNIWFCYNKGGVLQLNTNLQEIRWLSSEIGIPGNAPSSIIEDALQNIWIGSSKGLYRVNASGEVHAYSTEDGLNSMIFTPESAQKDALGKLWWGNDKGLVTFISDSIGLLRPKNNLRLTDLYINGNRFDADTLHFVKQLSSGKYSIHIHGRSNNNLEFRVVNLNYMLAQRNKYMYMITEIDSVWSNHVSNPVIACHNLLPGTYHLKIKTAYNDNPWTEVPLEIEFSIRPRFYETFWFAALLILIAASLVLYFTRNYINHMKIKLKTQLEDIRNKQSGAKTLKIQEGKADEIKDKLLKYMSEQKPFLNSELRLADVAHAIGFSVHEISHILNVEISQNFSDFINSYRVEEVKIRMKTADLRKFTLTAIAMQCGFSAKSSFLRAFKKATGTIPSEYFKEKKND